MLFELSQSFCLNDIKRVRLVEDGGQIFHRSYCKWEVATEGEGGEERQGNLENFETTLRHHKFFSQYISQ